MDDREVRLIDDDELDGWRRTNQQQQANKAMEARSMWLPPEEAVKNECWIVRRERRTHEARRKHPLHLPPALATAVKAVLRTSAFTRFTGVTARLCALKKPSNCREYSHDRSFLYRVREDITGL